MIRTICSSLNPRSLASVNRSSGNLFFTITNFLDLVNKPAVDARAFTNAADTCARHQCILDPENAVPLGGFDVLNEFVRMHQALAIIAQANSFVLQALAGLLHR